MLGRRSLRRSSLVFARDPVSAAASAALGRPVDAVTSDSPSPSRRRRRPRRRDVILNVSGLLWQDNPHLDARAYHEAVKTIARMLLPDSRSVALLPHVLDSHDRDNDAPAVDALAAEFGATSRPWRRGTSTRPERSSPGRGSSSVRGCTPA